MGSTTVTSQFSAGGFSPVTFGQSLSADDYVAACNNYGLELYNSQRYEEAIATCEKVIQLKPNHSIGWYGKACCYALQGNLELTIKNLQRSIKLNSQYRETAKIDSCFDAIREDERFQQLINH